MIFGIPLTAFTKLLSIGQKVQVLFQLLTQVLVQTERALRLRQKADTLLLRQIMVL